MSFIIFSYSFQLFLDVFYCWDDSEIFLLTHEQFYSLCTFSVQNFLHLLHSQNWNYFHHHHEVCSYLGFFHFLNSPICRGDVCNHLNLNFYFPWWSQSSAKWELKLVKFQISTLHFIPVSWDFLLSFTNSMHFLHSKTNLLSMTKPWGQK